MTFAFVVSSRVNITQVYLNEASSGTGPARFMFSVPQNATICAFETRKSNGEVTTWKARASEDGPHQHEIEGQNSQFLAFFLHILINDFIQRLSCLLDQYLPTELLRSN